MQGKSPDSRLPATFNVFLSEWDVWIAEQICRGRYASDRRQIRGGIQECGCLLGRCGWWFLHKPYLKRFEVGPLQPMRPMRGVWGANSTHVGLDAIGGLLWSQMKPFRSSHAIWRMQMLELGAGGACSLLIVSEWRRDCVVFVFRTEKKKQFKIISIGMPNKSN